jgi:phosphoribosylformylglycinamidine synthase
MKAAVIKFPGSNCDYDAYYALSQDAGIDTCFLWHKDTAIPKGTDLIILPGGFSYGDYLRCGSIARFSPIMREVINFADNGGFVMGICNGFQILTEAGLLEGALLRNNTLSFICKDVYLKITNRNIAYTSGITSQNVLRIPIAHNEGCYYAEESVLKKLEDNGQVVFRYCTPSGEVTPEANPNGALNNIAGITNVKGNVLGMMPHPERYSEDTLGCSDGLSIFLSLKSKFD